LGDYPQTPAQAERFALWLAGRLLLARYGVARAASTGTPKSTGALKLTRLSRQARDEHPKTHSIKDKRRVRKLYIESMGSGQTPA
jgi:hypothetical protein